jgi:hypothetical protein
MAFLDLSQVTTTLTSVLEQNINFHLQPGGPAVTAVPTAPHNVGDSVQNHLSLYLYHVSEDAYYRNAAGLGNDPPNVAKAPMGLCLYYILTAHHTSDQTDADPLSQQRILGLALKTLHDIPVITDNTEVNGTRVLPAPLRGRQNSLQIIMRQLSPEEAVNFWAGEDQQVTRLSAYYEVRVVFLEPEQPQRSPGIVLNVGSYVVQIGNPTLASSESRMPFALPPSYGGGAQSILARPARAIIDDRAVGAPPEHRRFELLGSNLSIGLARTLVLRHARWTQETPTLTEIEVDLTPPLNPDWRLTFRSDRVAVEFRSTLQYTDENGVIQTETLWPGIYAAGLQIILRRENLLGHPKEIVAASNQVPLLVAPRISGHTVGASTIQVDLGNEIDLTQLTENFDDLQVSVDGVVYTETSTNPPANPGEWFRLINGVVLNPHAGLDLTPPSPEVHSFRLVINGAETAPYFIELS